jgi:hypothetical protein
MWRAVALSLVIGVFAPRPGFGGPLEAYRWKARPVIVFGSESNEAFRRQIALLFNAAPGLQERDMVVIQAEDGNDRHNLHALYGVPPQTFEVLLVGKDGGVKFRSNQPLEPEEIFRTVDAMPMRREEMRQR